jgi:broad specificity phosphatase PhoE
VSARLILVRHGEPLGHAGRCIGHRDTELSPSAIVPLRRLAASATHDLARPARIVVSSDLRRAADSAAILARIWNSELRFDPRLRELSFGDWEGRPWEQIARDNRPAMDAWGSDWIRFSAPGGETGAALALRARAALHDLVAIAAAASTDVVAVTHAGWIRVATTTLLREALGSAFDRTIDYARAAIFDISAGNATLLAWNVETIDVGIPTSAFSLPPTPPSARS